MEYESTHDGLSYALVENAEAASRVVADRPKFHLQPLPKSWSNDPNGIHYDPKTGLYHMFYQHYPTGGKWMWGLSWGHACSADLKGWHHLPPVLSPTPGHVDEDGVWSGCAFPTDEGTVILNTACRKREKTPQISFPHLTDMGLEVIETQTYAISEPGDPLTRKWRKGDKPMLDAPPFKDLSGWRDPFLVGRPGDGLHDKYTMIIGAGHSKNPRGTALVYTSDSPTKDWQYRHELCAGDGTTGYLWECPLLAKVPPMPSLDSVNRIPGCEAEKHASPNDLEEGFDWGLFVCPDNADHAPVFWMGNYDHTTLKFGIDKARGPHAVDLGGHTFYAPNLLTNDPKGRLVMWGWCQETGRPEHISGEHEYGSCMSVPRLLWRHPRSPGRLWQEPLPSIAELRKSDASWWEGQLDLMPGKPFPLPREVGKAGHMELEVTFDPPLPIEPMEQADGVPADAGQQDHNVLPEVMKSGIMFRPHPHYPPHKSGIPSGLYGAALVYDWYEERLDVVYSNGRQRLDDLCALPYHTYEDMGVDVSDRMAGAVEERDLKGVHELQVCSGDGAMEKHQVDVAGTHIVGSKLHHLLDKKGNPEKARPLTLRIFLDHSLLEVFTCTGEVLTCRMYREPGQVAHGSAVNLLPLHHEEATIELVSFGAPTPLTHMAAHMVDEMWEAPETLHALEHQLHEASKQARAEAEEAADRAISEKCRHLAEMAEQEATKASAEATLIDQNMDRLLSDRGLWPEAPKEAVPPSDKRGTHEMQIRSFMEEHCQHEDCKDIDIHKYMDTMCKMHGLHLPNQETGEKHKGNESGSLMDE